MSPWTMPAAWAVSRALSTSSTAAIAEAGRGAPGQAGQRPEGPLTAAAAPLLAADHVLLLGSGGGQLGAPPAAVRAERGEARQGELGVAGGTPVHRVQPTRCAAACAGLAG